MFSMMVSTRGFIFFLVMPSMSKKRILPPSRAGIGRRLTIPRLTDNKPTKYNNDTKPPEA